MKIELKRNLTLKYTSALFFLFIFLNDHTIYSDFFGSTSTYFLIIASFFLAASIIIAGKIYSAGRMWIMFFLWAICVIIPCTVAGFTYLVFVRFCYWIALLLMLLILEKTGIDYRECLFTTIKVLCIWCFLCYFYTLFGFNFLPVTNISDELLYNWFNVELNGYLIYKNLVTFSLGNFSIIKLYSPLGEPGIASMYFNFAVIWILFFTDAKDKKNRRWLYIFSLAIILSFSMIGIIVLFAIYIVYEMGKCKITKIFLLSIPMILVSLILIMQKVGTESYFQRVNDYGVMFDVIIDKFPFGTGIGNMTAAKLGINTDLAGFYCGLLYPATQYGVFGLYYYYMMLVSGLKFSDNRFGRYAFFIYFILTLLTQPQADECFILSFIFAGVIKSSRAGHTKLNNPSRIMLQNL